MLEWIAAVIKWPSLILGFLEEIEKISKSPLYVMVKEFLSKFSKGQKRAIYFFCTVLVVCVICFFWVTYLGTSTTQLVFTVTDSINPVAGAEVCLGGSDKECKTTDRNGNVFYSKRKRNDSYIIVVNKKGYRPYTDTITTKDISEQKHDIQLVKNSLRIIIAEPSNGGSIETTGLTQIPVVIEFCDQDGKRISANCREIGLQFGKYDRKHACSEDKISRLIDKIPYDRDRYGLEDHLLKVSLGGITETNGIGFHREFKFANILKDGFKKLHTGGIVEKDGHISFELNKAMAANEIVAPQLLSCEKPITIETKAAFLNENASIIISVGRIYQFVLGEKNRNTLIVKKYNSYCNPPKWEAKGTVPQFEYILPINTPLSIKLRIEKLYNNSNPKVTLKISYLQDPSPKPRAIDFTGELPATDHTLDKTVAIGVGAYLETAHRDRAVRYDYLRISNSSLWTVNN